MITYNPNHPDNRKNMIEKIRAIRDKQKAIVAPFWNDLSEKERLELSHLAKFILAYDESIKIIKKFERPDFIIEHSGKTIGLEHERLLNLDEVQRIKSKQELFNKAADEFAERYSGIKVLINFWLIDGFEFRPNQKSSLIEEIVNFVYGAETGNNPSYPPYVKNVLRMPHTGVSFSYNEGVYSSTEMPETSLIEAIKKKEAKIADYKANSGLENQWLLLVSEIGADSFDIEDFKLGQNIESQFEHIYLLEDYEFRFRVIK